jgi:hypothetical protein
MDYCCKLHHVVFLGNLVLERPSVAGNVVEGKHIIFFISYPVRLYFYVKYFFRLNDLVADLVV